MIAKLTRYVAIIAGQKRKTRFLVSRLLWRTGLCRLFKIDRKGYYLRFYPTALSASLWVSKDRLGGEEFLSRILKPGDAVVDIGANIGTMCLKAASIVQSNGLVFAFEANPRTYKYLRKNISINNFGNIAAFNLALGAENGFLRFSNRGSDDQHSVSDTGELRVPVRRLDDFPLPKITLLKIDVEGYEKFVFAGGEMLISGADMIYFESNERHTRKYGYSSRELIEMLERKGFEVFKQGPEDALSKLPLDHVSEGNENLIALKDVSAFRNRSGFRIG